MTSTVRPGGARGAAFLAVLFALLTAPAIRAATNYHQTGFSESVVFSGLSSPTTVRFLPDGRVIVAEKSGLIKLFPNLTTNSYTVVADLRTNVHDFWDRGLLGLAVDPNFASNNYVYVLYTFDAPIGGTAPTWGPGDGTSDPCPTPPGATTDGCVVSGRLSRLTAVGSDWTSSETVLINDWCQQFPSHSVGSLNFGADGYLYVTAGEGSNFNNTDWGQWGGTLPGTPTPKNPCGDPPAGVGGDETPPSAEGGALRAQSPQRAGAEPRLLNGSVLRVDPATGDGVPGNPFFASNDPNARRIIGYGMRNPFRATIRPGTNDMWIADVGWNDWEEIDRLPDLTSARDYGWPCYEGTGHQPSYDAAALTICEDLYTAGTAVAPFLTYNHANHVTGDDGCPTGSSSIAGLAFYEGGSNYPSNYNGAMLFSDYSRVCMWIMFPDANGVPNPATTEAFASAAQGPVDIQVGPDGNFYYVDFLGGQVLKIQYGLHAIATGTPTTGPLPLTVQFDGSQSVPAQPGDTLSYSWDLNGDGVFGDSTLVQPTYQYTVAGTYNVRLKVTDQRGGSDISTPVVINAGNEDPTATITAPPGTLTWKVGDTINFAGTGTDPQDGTLPPSAFAWTIIIHHCPSDCHTHIYQTFSGVTSGSFVAPDHEYPSWLEIQLVVTDSDNNTGTASVLIYPQTVVLTMASVPSGLQLSIGTQSGPTPYTDTVIIGSANQVIAAPTQGAYPQIWEFVSWSDNGASTHVITAPPNPATYTATYTVHADLSIGMTGPAEICEGQPATYTLNVANAGLSQATSITVVDTPPPGATVVSASGDTWTCGGTAPIICTLPVLDITSAPPITVVLNAPVGMGTNTATVGSSVTDINGANNTASVNTTVDAAPAQPSITVANWTPVGAVGVPASVPDDPGSSWAWTLTGGSIDTGQGSSAITFDAGAPGTTMSLQVVESNGSGCASPAGSALVQVDFLDVPPAQIFHDYVDAIARNSITVGCGGGNYCPDAPNTRAQMAVFLLKAEHGASYTPPACAGIFADVPCPGGFAVDWIEQLANEGVTTGCGNGNYCPDAAVTRAQMAVFLLKTHLGSSYVPPPAVGIFGDVPPGSFAADWIEDLYNRSITGGCQASPLLYCPDNPNTRGQMATFITKTFGLP